MDEFVEGFLDLGDERPAGHGNYDVVGQAPTELLGDFVADGLRSLGVVRPEVDVDESPIALVSDLRAEAIHLIVATGNADEIRAKNLSA